MKHDSQCEMEIESLVEQALQGDQNALDLLLQSYRPRLCRLALRIIGNHEDAEDVVQDAYLSVLCHIKQFERRSKFSTWLTRVVINTALMARRSKRTNRGGSRHVSLSNDESEEPIEISDLRPGPEQACSATEIGVVVHEQINRLPSPLRPVFELHYVDGLSCVEAGESLGISVSAVKSRVLRARRQMVEGLNRNSLGALLGKERLPCGQGLDTGR